MSGFSLRSFPPISAATHWDGNSFGCFVLIYLTYSTATFLFIPCIDTELCEKKLGRGGVNLQ